MKIIDLLNKIANGEDVPKKIKYEGYIRDYVDSECDYSNFTDDCDNYLFFGMFRTGTEVERVLNDEVEIIEDKKIEKIEPLGIDYMTLDDIKFTFSNSEMVIVNKINEIIDKINEVE